MEQEVEAMGHTGKGTMMIMIQAECTNITLQTTVRIESGLYICRGGIWHAWNYCQDRVWAIYM